MLELLKGKSRFDCDKLFVRITVGFGELCTFMNISGVEAILTKEFYVDGVLCGFSVLKIAL